ncbi:unnamed protein product [Musa acuminata subsp. malaccensis]|uniref:(wild Malaysian banana) hypothetical protein n=1 Tax=Musa acuminata subsp. malaccensis TaxID=214687 RepID=A0A804L2P0_MUSAM|nr:PREDICTED: uncharacterized protein LOC103970056 [Musa acuminata subsp. malaccensis]CAG1863130.1 unnamed protein product [Musa acuminata subsp. malaccensis]
MKKLQPERKPKGGEKKKKNRKEKVAGDDKTKKKNLSRKKMEGVGEDRNQANKKRKSKEGVTKKEEAQEKKRSRNGDIGFSSFIAADKESGGGGSASCSFPMSRVRRLMRLEGGNANVTISGISSDAVFLVNKASEMFLEKFVKDSFSRGMRRQKKSVTYKDLSSTVHSKKRYEFLSDFVPEKVKAEDALKARALVVGT